MKPKSDDRPKSPRRVPWEWILGITLVAGVLRLIGLGDKPPWIDELITFLDVQRGWGEIMTDPKSDTNPPLFYLITAVFAKISDSVSTLRLPSVLSGTVLVAIMGWAGAMMGGRKTGILVAILVAASPFQIRVSQEARMYTLLAVMSLLTMIACHRAAERGRERDGLWLGVLLALTVAIHYSGLALFAAVAARFLLEGPRLKTVWKPCVVALGTAGLLISPLGSMIAEAHRYSLAQTIPAGAVEWRPSMLWLHFVGYMRALDPIPLSRPFLGVLGVILFLILIVGLRPLFRELAEWGKTLLSFSIIPGIVAFAYLVATNPAHITDRVFSFAYPACIILLAFALVRLSRPQVRTALVLSLVGVNLVTIVALYRTPEAFSRGWEEALARIGAEGGEKRPFLALPDRYGELYGSWFNEYDAKRVPARSVLDADPAERFPDGVYLLTLDRGKGPAKIFGEDRRILGRLGRAFPEKMTRRLGDLRIDEFLPGP